jgi:hypothetical protein
LLQILSLVPLLTQTHVQILLLAPLLSQTHGR